MSSLAKLSTLVVLFVFATSIVDARQCYLCGNYYAEFIDCQYPQETTCIGSCGKETVNGMTKKGCFKVEGQERYRQEGCFNDPANGGWFCTCNSDRCNSSIKSRVAGWSALIGAIGLIGWRFVLW